MLRKGFWKKIILLLGVIGPGLITANLDNDAGGIATYSIAGSVTGFRLLWLLFPITVALIMAQEMGVRMAIATGKGLSDLIREQFGLKVSFYALFFLLLADIGNTMAEFAGIAAAGEIFALSKYLTVPLSAIIIWFFIIKGTYRLVEKVFLIGCSVFISYIISGLLVSPDWSLILQKALVPQISSITLEDMPIVVGLIGTSITPWMQFYIQSSILEKGVSLKDLNFSRIDVIVGCLLMFLVSFFIVVCCAATLYQEGIIVTSAKDAALALRPFAGKYATALFSFGLFNASFFAAALLPLATSYYICEGLGWESGLDKKFNEAPQFFSLFTGILLVGSLLILLPHIDLVQVLLWTQVLNGILIPVVLFWMLKLCNTASLMGKYRNRPWQNICATLIIGVMTVANIILIYAEIK